MDASQTAVVGDDRFVAEDHAVLYARAPPDMTMPAEDGAADHRLLADSRIGPDNRVLDRGMLLEMALAADDAVRPDPRSALDHRSLVHETRPGHVDAFFESGLR